MQFPVKVTEAILLGKKRWLGWISFVPKQSAYGTVHSSILRCAELSLVTIDAQVSLQTNCFDFVGRTSFGYEQAAMTQNLWEIHKAQQL